MVVERPDASRSVYGYLLFFSLFSLSFFFFFFRFSFLFQVGR